MYKDIETKNIQKHLLAAECYYLLADGYGVHGGCGWEKSLEAQQQREITREGN